MGFTIQIKTDKLVTREDFESIAKALPEWMNPYPYIAQQEWGWSLLHNLQFNEGAIAVDGARCFRKTAMGFAEAFARRLEHKGYKVEVGEYED